MIKDIFERFGIKNAEEKAKQMTEFLSKYNRWRTDPRHLREVKWEIIRILFKQEKEEKEHVDIDAIVAKEKQIIEALKREKI